MAKSNDQIVTLVLSYGPRGRHPAEVGHLRVSRAQAVVIQDMHNNTRGRKFCGGDTADGIPYFVCVGTESGLVEVVVEDRSV
jgi:hypothetical protein